MGLSRGFAYNFNRVSGAKVHEAGRILTITNRLAMYGTEKIPSYTSVGRELAGGELVSVLCTVESRGCVGGPLLPVAAVLAPAPAKSCPGLPLRPGTRRRGCRDARALRKDLRW